MQDASFSNSEFPDCPFLGHKLYYPLKEHYKHTLGLLYLACRRDTGEKVVIKLIERGASVTRHVASELLLHRAVSSNPLFAQLLDVFLTPYHLAIVMEHVGGGDILDLVEAQGVLCEDQARWLFQQLVVGLMVLHSRGAVNREIKLQNKLLKWGGPEEEDGSLSALRMRGPSRNGILSRLSPSGPVVQAAYAAAAAAAAAAANAGAASMERSPSPSPNPRTMTKKEEGEGVQEEGEEGKAITTTTTTSPATTTINRFQDPSGRPHVKIQDFAYSKSEQINSDPHSALSSLPYTAPEVLSSSNGALEGTATDVWALGVALFKMVTGMYPFERREDHSGEARTAVQAVLNRIAHAEFCIPHTLSPSLQDLLARMLVKDPGQRMRLDGIVQHPWVRQDLPEELLKTIVDVESMNKKDGDSGGGGEEGKGEGEGGNELSEASLKELIEKAQQSLRPFDSENVDDLADEILNEEEAEDFLDELSLE